MTIEYNFLARGGKLVRKLWKLIPWQFVRFGIVGTGGYTVDATLLTSFVHHGMDPYNGQIIAFIAAAGFTWMVNRFWTFRAQRARSRHTAEGIRYFIAMCFGCGVNFIIYATLVTIGGLWVEHPWLAAAMGSIGGLFFNYPASKFFVFKEPVQDLPEGSASSLDP
jgi:putative flippase GtrA